MLWVDLLSMHRIAEVLIANILKLVNGTRLKVIVPSIVSTLKSPIPQAAQPCNCIFNGWLAWCCSQHNVFIVFFGTAIDCWLSSQFLFSISHALICLSSVSILPGRLESVCIKFSYCLSGVPFCILYFIRSWSLHMLNWVLRCICFVV